MGYPKCDGDIMVSNPYWVDTKENFKSRISQFIEKPTPKALMELAIIFDGDVVFGDEKPMREIKEFIISKMGENSYTMNSFANATLMFETPLTLFKNFLLDEKHGGELNIKKGGIFAIVHGVRALSIEHSIFETNSVERVKALNNIGIINREFALELIEAFDTLLSLRLVARLSKIDSGKEVDNYLNPASISHFKRDILKDSFKIVDRFKKFITYHFKLDRIG
jgi:CBS domain-containing protein